MSSMAKRWLLNRCLRCLQEALERSRAGELQPQLYDLEAVDELMTVYVEQMVHVMRTWSTNLLKMDKDGQQFEQTPEGMCRTDVPTDMFKMITQQMTLAESSGLPKVVVRVCQGLVPVLDYYQTTLSRQIRDSWKKWEVEYLGAQVNDNAKCMELLKSIMGDAARYKVRREPSIVNMPK